jgi:hypothetical protein
MFFNFTHEGAFESIAALTSGQRAVPAAEGASLRTWERPAPNAVIRFP